MLDPGDIRPCPDLAARVDVGVTTGNVLVGLLRAYDGVFAELVTGTGTDMRKLSTLIGDRLLPDRDPLAGKEIPADAGAEAALRIATAEADSGRRESVTPAHLLPGLMSEASGPGARLLGKAGATEAGLRENLRSAV